MAFLKSYSYGKGCHTIRPLFHSRCKHIIQSPLVACIQGKNPDIDPHSGKCAKPEVTEVVAGILKIILINARKNRGSRPGLYPKGSSFIPLLIHFKPEQQGYLYQVYANTAFSGKWKGFR